MQKRVVDELESLDAALGQTVSRAVKKLPLDTAEPARAEESIAAKRRRRGKPPPGQLATVGLVRSDGVLRWTYQRPPNRVGPRRTRFRAARMVGARPIVEFSFQEVPPNEVIRKLQELDDSLTPNQGLRRWQGGVLAPIDQPAATARSRSSSPTARGTRARLAPSSSPRPPVGTRRRRPSSRSSSRSSSPRAARSSRPTPASTTSCS